MAARLLHRAIVSEHNIARGGGSVGLRAKLDASGLRFFGESQH